MRAVSISGMNVCVFILMFLFVPDTSGYTLEELDYVFAVPTRRFISYQIRQVCYCPTILCVMCYYMLHFRF
jgi:hypothetical protein